MRTKIIFCAQSQTRNRTSGTFYLRTASQGLSCQFLKTFSVFPDPIHRVSEDGPNVNHFRSLQNLDEKRVKIFVNFSRRHLITHTCFFKLINMDNKINEQKK